MDWNKFSNLKILIIDDDQFTRELVQTMLKKLPNIEIDQAANGLEALGMIEKVEYDLYLLDLYMPKMDGREFINALKTYHNTKSLPIVLITTDRLGVSELKSIGAKYYLTKPFDFHNFLKDIYGFLEEERRLNEA